MHTPTLEEGFEILASLPVKPEGRTLNELSQLTGLTMKTIRGLEDRAMKKLRAAMAVFEPDYRHSLTKNVHPLVGVQPLVKDHTRTFDMVDLHCTLWLRANG